MATSGEAGEADHVSTREAAAKTLAGIANASAASVALSQALRCGLIGAGVAGVAWLIDWVLGSQLALPAAVARAEGWPPIAGPVLAILVWSLFGAAYGSVAVIGSRWAISGRLQLPEYGSPSVKIAPAWWVRVIRDAFFLYIVFLVIAAVWAAFGSQGGASYRDVPTLPQYLGMAAAFAILLGFVFRIQDGISWVVGRFVKPFVIAWPAAWLVICAATGVLATLLFAIVFIGIALLLRPAFSALGLGSTVTLSGVLPLMVLAIKFGIDLGRWQWEDRAAAVGRPKEPIVHLPSQSDFRNWDLDVETSYPPDAASTAVDDNGYPYFLWRESADNRIGLSRPRYCCITPHDGELYFTFFNPSGKVRPSGGLAIGLLVTALIAVTMLAGYWFTPRPYIPYHLDERPPPVLVVLNVALFAPLVGGVIGGLWHVLVLLLRWQWSRFAGDGTLSALPLRELRAFTLEDAGAVGAKVNGERATSGKGLSATFADDASGSSGASMVLTGNSWEEMTMRAYHKILTNMFVDRRDELVRAWDQRQKEVKRTSGEPDAHREPSLTPAPRRYGQGIPDQL